MFGPDENYGSVAQCLYKDTILVDGFGEHNVLYGASQFLDDNGVIRQEFDGSLVKKDL